MNIGDLIFSLIADGSKLTPSVEKEAGKAADAGSKTLNSKMASSLRTDGVRAFGVAAAGAFAIATKGALELEDIQNDFQSETGASAEEAKRTGKVINQVAGENQQSLQAVSDAAISIHNDLGAVGDEADKLLGQFTKFGRVTKQEPVAAVKAFDDILDAWNLTADDSHKVMDTLVVSHQKYGGSVADDQAALAALAPTLKAMNGTWQDAIGLLDLAKASGIDSADAITGLNKALGKVKSPEELQRLIDDISNTTDPFLRAQKAADLFGQKAGPKLANALAGKHLQDFAINMDDAAGATDRAADALDQGFGAQARKKLSEFGAALRGLGADWGPLLTGAAGFASLAGALGLDTIVEKLGPKFVEAMKVVGTKGGDALIDAAGAATGAAGTIFGNVIADPIAAALDPDRNSLLGRLVRGSSARLGAMAGSAAGQALGTALSIAASAAIVAAPIVITWELVRLGQDDEKGKQDSIQPIIDRIQQEGEERAKLIADIAQLQQKANLQKGNTEGIGGFVMGLFGDPAKEKALYQQTLGQLDQLKAALAAADDKARDMRDSFGAAGTAAAAATAAGVAAGAPAVTSATVTMVDDATAAAGYAANKKAYEAGRAIPDNTAAGIRSRRQAVMDAFDQLKQDLKNALNPAKEEARIIGVLTSKAMARGLHSGDPVVRKQAEELRTTALNRLEELVANGKPLGKDAAQAVADGLKSRNPRVRATAQLLAKMLPNALDNQKGNAKNKGSNLGKAAASGLKAGFGHPVLTADIHIRGTNNTQGKAIGGPVLAGTPYWVNEHTPRSEMFVPSTGGHVLTHAQAVNALKASGGDTTLNVNVYPGSDVSPTSARRYGQVIRDEVAVALRDQRMRTTGTSGATP